MTRSLTVLWFAISNETSAAAVSSPITVSQAASCADPNRAIILSGIANLRHCSLKIPLRHVITMLTTLIAPELVIAWAIRRRALQIARVRALLFEAYISVHWTTFIPHIWPAISDFRDYQPSSIPPSQIFATTVCIVSPTHHRSYICTKGQIDQPAGRPVAANCASFLPTRRFKR
jgi:hypothetical protein